MSEHTWALENLTGYVVGELDAAERERLEEHAAGCAACARALEEARAVDISMDALFAGERPGPALEDRMIQALRATPPRRGSRRISGRFRMMVGAAAAVLLAAVGAGASTLMEEEHLTFPGAARRDADGLLVTVVDDSLSMKREKRKERDGDEAGEKAGLEFYSPALALVTRGSGRVHTKVNGGILSGEDGRISGLGGTPLGRVGEPIQGVNTFYSSSSNLLKPGLGTGTTHHGLNFRLTGVSNTVKTDELASAREKDKLLGLGNGTMASYSRQTYGGFGYDRGKQAPPPVADPAVTYFKPGDAFAGPGEKKKPDEKLDDKKPADNPPPPPDRGGPLKKDPKAEPGKPEQPPAALARKVIRSGDVEFEVQSFDDSVATVTRLVAATKDGFVATVNSDKLANGKVRGAVVVRVPPEQLDKLVLDLRKELGKTGELKSQRIGSQDVTKQYTDLESRLRAARAMEERLLRIIRDGKGDIKDLIAAEKELGVWRTKIEESEGELRYYANLVSLSTLTVNLTEKEIRTAASVSESERVQAGVEVDDVAKAMGEVLDAVAAMKGRVTKSEMKQHGLEQFNALLHFTVPHKDAGVARDRLKQIGTVVRLEIDRVQHAENGTKLPREGEVKRGDTLFVVSLYNLINVEARETVTLKLAATDVTAAYQALKKAVEGADGRVVTSQLNEQDRQNVTAQLDFHVRREKEGAVQSAVGAAGEVLARNVARAAKKDENVTDKKVFFKVELVPAATIKPRETVTLGVEVADVELTLAALTAQVKDAQGRVTDSQAAQERNGRVTARAVFDVPLSAAGGLIEKVKAAGTVRVQQTTRDPQAPEGKLALARLDVTLANGELLVPRDEGFWSQARGGLSFSLRGLSVSASWLIVGVLFVLPWALLIWAGVWLVRRLRGRGEAAPAGAAAPRA